MQGSHRFFSNERFKIGWVLMTTWSCHDQTSPRRQGPEKLPDGDIKAERGLLQHAILCGQVIRLLHPTKAVVDSSVGIHNPFRFARRAGCVDDICQIIWLHPRGKIVFR